MRRRDWLKLVGGVIMIYGVQSTDKGTNAGYSHVLIFFCTSWSWPQRQFDIWRLSQGNRGNVRIDNTLGYLWYIATYQRWHVIPESVIIIIMIWLIMDLGKDMSYNMVSRHIIAEDLSVNIGSILFDCLFCFIVAVHHDQRFFSQCIWRHEPLSVAAVWLIYLSGQIHQQTPDN